MLYVMLTPTEREVKDDLLVLSGEVNGGEDLLQAWCLGVRVKDDLLVFSGEVGRSWRYCNARPTRDEAGASS